MSDSLELMEGEAPRPDLPVEKLVVLLRADQSRRWRTGRPLPVAAYLDRFPEVRANSTCALDLIWSEFLIRESLDDRPSLEDYVRGFPEFAAQLEQQHRVHQWVEDGEDSSWLKETFADQAPRAADSAEAEFVRRRAIENDLPVAIAHGYEILDEIGRGGMGVVYRAYDQRRAEVVALKMMRGGDPASLYRFKKEFRGLANISHPNLVTLRELASDGQDWFFTMDLIDGVDFLAFARCVSGGVRDLPTTRIQAENTERERVDDPPSSEVLVVQGPPRFDLLRDGMRQLAEGVGALHEAGWVHRDLKPTNVLVTPEGRVVILDFGLGAELSPSGMHQSSGPQLLGTAAYMSPEQASGRAVTPASDWYSVGVMLYEALTGRLPFTGAPLEVLMDKQRRDPPRPAELTSGLPDDLSELCAALLAREPEARPAAAEIMRSLQARVSASPPWSRSSVTAGSAHRLIGRREHLRALEEAYHEMRERGPVLVHLRGPSGVGKTALVETFVENLSRHDEAIVLAGRCHPQESVPYKALDGVIDALAQSLRRLPPAEVDAILPRDFPYLCQVFPTLRMVQGKEGPRRRTQEIVNPRELRKRGIAALRDLLGRLGDRRSVVVLIDDLHWGDHESASLVVDLLEPPDPPSLLLLACYHCADARSSPFLRRLETVARSRRGWLSTRELPVDELAAEDALELARDLCGDDFPPARRASIAAAAVREAAGNPFFISELVRHARHRSDRWNDLSAGQTVRLADLVEARLRALSPPARKLLEIIAVFGRPIGADEAFRAAGLLTSGSSPLDALRAARLIRPASAQAPHERYEPYHDRIREIVLSLLDPASLAAHHLSLATALKEVDYPDPEAVGVHLREAGLPLEASRYFAAAGDRAVDVLAFDRASAVYRHAIELGSAGPAESRALRIKLGESLAKAGRGGEAAEEFLKAAFDDSAESLDLRRRAALQYLISGRVDEGLATLRDVVEAVGMSIPTARWETLWALVRERARVPLGKVSRRRAQPSHVREREFSRIDTCWSASIGLSIIDPIRGAVFQARSLRLALRAGEPRRIVRALAMEAAHVACAGRPASRRSASLLHAAESAAPNAAEPYTRGILSLAHAIVAYLEGRWSETRRFAENAEDTFRTSCTGVAWEIDTARIFWLWALNFLGEFADLRRRWREWMKDARERGDVYLEGTLGTLMMALVRIADDEPDSAREELQQSAQVWSNQGFHVQHHNHTLARCVLSLYRSESTEVWELLESLRASYARSLLLRIQIIRIELERFRARGALAAATARGGGRSAPFLREAERAARRLESERVPLATAHALSIRAQVAAADRETVQSRRLFESAIHAFHDLGMSIFAAAARRELGRLLADEQGQVLIDEADQWMVEQGIRAPARMAAVYVAPSGGNAARMSP